MTGYYRVLRANQMRHVAAEGGHMSKNVTLWSILLWLGPLSERSSPQTMPSPATHWSFSRCAGGIVPDESGGGHDLILKKGADCAPAVGRPGRAGIFDGVDALAETQDNRLNLRDYLTVSAWVKPDRVSGVQNIVNKWYAADSYALALRDDCLRPANRKGPALRERKSRGLLLDTAKAPPGERPASGHRKPSRVGSLQGSHR